MTVSTVSRIVPTAKLATTPGTPAFVFWSTYCFAFSNFLFAALAQSAHVPSPNPRH